MLTDELVWRNVKCGMFSDYKVRTYDWMKWTSLDKQRLVRPVRSNFSCTPSIPDVLDTGGCLELYDNDNAGGGHVPS